MKVATIIARILLGILFIVAGGADFFVRSPPPQPGLAGQFNELFFHSHWVLFIGAAQVVIGILLLINRYVPVALIMLAAFLYNSYGFHITMAQSTIFAPIVVTVLWFIIAWNYREVFAPIFRAKQEQIL